MTLEKLSDAKCFGGQQAVYQHQSEILQCPMRFSVFTPPQASDGPVPVLWYLSGLTCTEENATIKAGFQRTAAELGLMIICPDTSPRGDHVPDVPEWDFGKGAGFYLDATEAPWRDHYKMESYITIELQQLALNTLPISPDRQGISGHSMGGHGALTLWLKHPALYRSVSAFSPIVSPINCPWGQKALTGYLGSNETIWRKYDTCTLLRDLGARENEILVDQGLADNFLEEQLKPELLKDAAQATGQKLVLRMHEGYDHSYYFIATFMEDHLRHHAALLSTHSKGA